MVTTRTSKCERHLFEDGNSFPSQIVATVEVPRRIVVKCQSITVIITIKRCSLDLCTRQPMTEESL